MENERKFVDKYHILVVDDDKKLRSLLRDFVNNHDEYIASCVSNAEEAAKLIEKVSVDIMILDGMMPGMSGFDFVKKLRDDEYQFPILMLSALGDVESKIKGLEAGADDYLAKPFAPEELLLRIKNILNRFYRRREKQVHNNKDKFIFGEDYEFDMSKKFLTKAGEELALSYSEGTLLSYFIKNKDNDLDREQLAEALNLSDSLRAVDVQVTRLRKKIEINPKKPNFILTVRNKGYKFISY